MNGSQVDLFARVCSPVARRPPTYTGFHCRVWDPEGKMLYACVDSISDRSTGVAVVDLRGASPRARLVATSSRSVLGRLHPVEALAHRRRIILTQTHSVEDRVDMWTLDWRHGQLSAPPAGQFGAPSRRRHRRLNAR